MLLCQYCKKECKNKLSLSCHERLCKNNPNRKRSSIEKYRDTNPSPWNKGKKLDFESWNKGKPGTFAGKKHSEETKAKMSNSRKELYTSGWESTAGRCKKYDYFSPIAGKIKVDGTWELKFSKFLDENKLNWRRNKTRFNYIKPDGSPSTYQPDFYIEEFKSYIEIKGYETDLDRCKWSQFTEPLMVLKEKEIGRLDEWLKSVSC